MKYAQQMIEEEAVMAYNCNIFLKNGGKKLKFLSQNIQIYDIQLMSLQCSNITG
jgi:hypothetical protein